LALLPLTVGIGFEFLMYAGKHDNFLIRMLSAPGILMQKITTKEPTDAQIEVAIKALKLAIPEDFPNEECLAPDPKPEAEKSEPEQSDTPA
jgi:uncharacterized protein YqhQ